MAQNEVIQVELNQSGTSTLDLTQFESCLSNIITPPTDCDCEGRMQNFTFTYTGTSGASIYAYDKDGNLIHTYHNVTTGASITVEGTGAQNRLDAKTYLQLAGEARREVHTSCSEQIIGNTYGSFLVTAYTDGDGDQCFGNFSNVNVISDKQLFSCDDLGENLVTLTFYDRNGNTCDKEITVNVVDNLAPVVSTKDIIKYVSSGEITIAPEDILKMNCSGGGISMNIEDKSLWSNQYVNAVPNGGGFFTNPQGNCTYDNCGIASYELSKSTFTCSDAGENIVTITVTDHSGNETTATAKVTIRDSQAPIVYGKDIEVELGADGNVMITPDMVDDGSYDPCGSLTLELSKSVFSCEEIGEQQVTLIGYDDSGNSASTNVTVTVKDNLAPEVVTQNITITLDINNQASLDPMDLLVVCDDAVIDLDSGDDGGLDGGGFDLGGFDLGGFDLGGFGFGGFSPDSKDFSRTAGYSATSPFVVNSFSVEGCTTDNCKITGIEASVTDFDCSNIGENIVTVTVTDDKGNSTEATAIVTIVDNISPVVSAQDFTLNLDENGTATLEVSDIEISSADNCSIVAKDLSKTNFSCEDLGDNVVTLTVTDGSGNEGTATVTITVEDNVAPTVIAQDATVYLNANGNASITVADIDNGSSDNCSLTLSLNNLSFDCDDLGENTVTLTGTDESGNTASATATVTVVDNIDPVITAKDFSGFLDANGELTITKNDVIQSLSDNCSIGSVTISQTEFDCADLGENTVTITVTDAAGNTATETATVTVADNAAPIVTVQNVDLKLDANGNATLEVANAEVSSSDNCGIASKVLSQTAFDCEDLGTNTVSLTVTDASGNQVTEAFTVTIIDNTAPTVIAQDATVYLDANGNASITVGDIDNGSSDNCSLQLSLNNTNFDCDDLGENTVTLTGTDASGNTATGLATVTVVDNIAPIIETVETLNVELGENGTVTITETQVVTSIANDNCGSVTTTISQTDFDCEDLGENTITVTVTDGSGNSTTSQVDVFIIDSSTPVWTNPTSGGSTSVTSTNPLAPAMDFNVFIKEDITFKSNETEGAVALGGDLTIDGNYQVSTNSIGSFEVENVPVTLVVGGKVNYSGGNSLQVNQNGYAKIGEQNGSKVWYQDMNGAYTTMRVTKNNNYNSSPRLHLQAHANQLGVSEQNNHIFEANVIDFDAAFTQFEASAAAMSQLNNNADLTNPNGQPISNTNLPNQVKINLQDGLNVLNVTGSDLNNVSVFTFNNQPSANRILLINVDQPGNFYWNAYNTGGIGEHVAPYIIYNFYNTTFLQVQGNGSLIGSLFAPFAHINKTSHNNISGQIVGKSMMQASGENHMFAFNGEIEGATAGETTEIEQGSTVTKLADENNCSYTVQGSEFTPGASDTFCSEVTLTYALNGATTGTGNDLSGVAFNVGTTTVTWTASDGQNTTTFTFTVVVEDATAPTAIAQDITVNLDANGSATITANQVNNGSHDNCGTPSFSIDKQTFDCEDLGENEVTLSVTDASGNTATATAIVTIIDNIAPTVIAQDATVYLNANGNASITVADIDNGSSDNCSLTLSLNNLSFDCDDLGENTVTLTGTDESGNTASATATVTVVDNIDPVITAKDFSGFLDANGELTITKNDVIQSLSDNCSIGSVTIYKTEFDCADLGENTVTITVTDAAGNTATETATVTVADNAAPIVTVQNVDLKLDANGNATLEVANAEVSSSDNCGIASKVLSQTAFDCEDLGTNTVSLTVTDASGNQVTEAFTVTIIDNTAPTVIAQDATVYLNANGNASITVADIDNGSSDNCSLQLSLNNTNFDCDDLGENTVTLTGTDASGNTATASATVTVVDAIDPVVSSKNFLGYLDANGELTITKNDVIQSLSDNCSIGSVTISKTEFDCADLGENTVTITVTDAAGNTATETATVTVADNAAPIVTVQNVNLNLDTNGNATLEVADAEVSSSDNCGIASKVLSQTAFDCEDLGTNTVSLTVTDASGNQVTEAFTVTIIDNTAPTVIAQDATVYLDANGNASITVADIDNGSSDNCSLTLSLNNLSFDCDDLGENTVILTGTDASGNTATALATVTVVDAIDPVVSVKNFLGYLDANGELTITKNDVIQLLSDNCSIGSVTINKTEFDCADLGENTVTITLTDAAGNTTSATSTVTIEDKTAPIISNIPSNITVQAVNGCSATATWNTPQVSDNCSATIVSNYTSGQSFNVGTTTVTYTATDGSGNTSVASFNVTVTASPIVIDLAPTELENGYNISCYNGTDGEISAAVSGGCGTYTYVWSNGATSPSISNLSAGTYSLTVTDGQGNTQSETVTISQPNALTVNTTMTPAAPGGNNTEEHTIYLGYGQQSVTLSANATGGSGEYIYTWSPNEAMGCIDGNTVEVAPLVTTTYSVIVTDAMGCSATKDITVDVIDVRCTDNGNGGGDDDDDDDDSDDDDDDDNGGYPGGGNSGADCQCEGKMKNFTVVYTGYSGATVKAYNKKKNTIIKTFYNVQYGQTLKVEGFDHKGRLDSKTYLKIGGSYTEIHTSCSISILGETYGAFKVIEYTDGEGSTCQDPSLDDFEGPQDDDDDDNHHDDDDNDHDDDDDDDKGKDKDKNQDFVHSDNFKNLTGTSIYNPNANTYAQGNNDFNCQCEGKMKNFTVVYKGSSGVTVRAYNKKKNSVIKTFYNVQYGQELKVEGFDHKGRLDSKTYLKVGGSYTEIHTSCSINILGETYGAFKVIEYTDGEGSTCTLTPDETNECGLTLTQWSGNITICYNGAPLCVPQSDVGLYLSQGATIGNCGDGNQARNTGDLAADLSDTDSPAETIIEVDITAYPNPTKDYAKITFSTNTTALGNVAVYDTRGMVIGKLYEGNVEAGETYNLEFNGSDVSNGVYLIRVNLGNHVETKKLLIKH